jgi:N-acetylmuramoyl-L-alanine amidase
MSLAPSEGKGYRIAVDVFRRADGPTGDGPPLICVDPGHGGSDPGATGVSGAKEKDVNLAMSLLLAEDLRNAGLKVIMTRTDDSLPALHDRPVFANTAAANLFVSVHNNAMPDDSGANGTETYYWGDSDGYSEEAYMLAAAIQNNLVDGLGSLDRGVKTAKYVVLAETEMPAALVEVGFMTNRVEEAKLVTTGYQQAAARAIAAGVLEYLDWSTRVYTTEL